jgi:hypothetical protein
VKRKRSCFSHDWQLGRALWDGGLRVDEIAARLGCHPMNVYKRASVAGWPKRNIPRRAYAVRVKAWHEKAMSLWERGVYSTKIAKECGVADTTVCQIANSRGWQRPAGYNPNTRPCHHPNPARYPDGSCIECRREKASARTPEYRREQRRLDRARDGKVYRTREEWRSDNAKKSAARRAAKENRPKRARAGIGAKCIALLLAEDPSATGLHPSTLQFRARYRFDPSFRAKQIERTHAKKSKEMGNALTSDGSLDANAILPPFRQGEGVPVLWQSHAITRQNPRSHHPKVEGRVAQR